MLTDTVAAWQVEETDLITLGSEDTFTVTEKRDTGDGIDLMLTNDDGEHEWFYFTPDDDIALVVSLDDTGESEVDFTYDSDDEEVPDL